MKYPSLGPVKKQDELRSCKSCNLTVMAKGDWHGWKGVDIGGGQLDWFCDKMLCRQARDETIAMRSRELMAEQAQNERLGAENRELAEARQRIADLERENEALKKKRQTSASAEAEPAEVAAQPTQGFAPVETHLAVSDGAKKGLCGNTRGPFVRPSELTWDTNPCSQCGLIWSQIQNGERTMPVTDPPPDPRLQFVVNVPSSEGDGTKYRVALGAEGLWTCECEAFKYRQTCKHIAVAQKLRGDAQAPLVKPTVEATAEVVESPPEAASAAASALYGERPQPPKLEELPRFTPALITKVHTEPGNYIGKPILVPPEAYPDMDMKVIEPEKLRGGIGALMGLPVDRIERAYHSDGGLAGIVFTLKRLS